MGIARYIIDQGVADELWFVVSPQNPFKAASGLAADGDRLEMVKLAIGKFPKLRASDIEFDMPKPSYSIDTLIKFSGQYPTHKFVLLIGSDNRERFPQWKNHGEIVKNYDILVYPRGLATGKASAELAGAPLFEANSTSIREKINRGEKPSEITDEVYTYITENKLYMDTLTTINASIAFEPENAELYVTRGKFYHKTGILDMALSDFLHALELNPNHKEAKVHVEIIQNIFKCRFTDIYNP